MLGQQGVGKSSLANTLLGFDNLASLSDKKIRKSLPFKAIIYGQNVFNVKHIFFIHFVCIYAKLQPLLDSISRPASRNNT
jgi:septin family protein